MFSVNIDKLVAMTEREETAYTEICEKVIARGRKFKSISLLNNAIVAFKLADTIRKTGNSVLFVDADFSSSVFLGKYKLGKNLKGVCEYLSGDELPNDIVCYTNKDDMNIVFTGDVDTHAIITQNEAAFSKLISFYEADYDYVIVSAGGNTDIAKECDGTIVVMENGDYSERKAKKEIQRLDNKGCLSIGIVINNA